MSPSPVVLPEIVEFEMVTPPCDSSKYAPPPPSDTVLLEIVVPLHVDHAEDVVGVEAATSPEVVVFPEIDVSVMVSAPSMSLR